MTPLTTFGLLLMAFNIVYFAIYINRQIQAGKARHKAMKARHEAEDANFERWKESVKRIIYAP